MYDGHLVAVHYENRLLLQSQGRTGNGRMFLRYKLNELYKFFQPDAETANNSAVVFPRAQYKAFCLSLTGPQEF